MFFEVHHIEAVRYSGCDFAFWITGWHEDDTRYILHCTGDPQDVTHLEGNWWQLEDKIPPDDL